MNTKIKMERINRDWCELEEEMGEQAALHVACDNHNVDTEWFYDHIELIAISKN